MYTGDYGSISNRYTSGAINLGRYPGGRDNEKKIRCADRKGKSRQIHLWAFGEGVLYVGILQVQVLTGAASISGTSDKKYPSGGSLTAMPFRGG